MVARAVVVYPGGFEVFASLEEALEAAAQRRGAAVLYCLRGEMVVLRVEAPRSAPAAPPRHPASGGRVAAVFDQMFKGFAEIVGREAPGAEMHEIVGRGLREPVRAGRVVKWPARDDYDVLEIVRRLAGEGKIVVFFTGDKKLARQAEALGDERIRVYYMPPGEYPGKEDLARAMIEAVREALGEAGD